MPNTLLKENIYMEVEQVFKKIISKCGVVLAVALMALVFGGTGTQAATQIGAPSNIQWLDNMTGFTYTPATNGTGYYYAWVCDGEGNEIFSTHIQPGLDSEGTCHFINPVTNWATGTYKIKMSSNPHGTSMTQSDWVWSDEKSYTSPSSQLSKPTVKLNGYKVEVSELDSCGYAIRLEGKDGSWWMVRDRVLTHSSYTWDLSSYVPDSWETGDYTVKVAALSTNLTSNLDSEWSSSTLPGQSSAGAAVENLISGADGNSDAVKTSLSSNESTVINALTNSDSATEAIKDAESSYNTSKSITVATPVVDSEISSKINASDVSIVGAGFNTPDNTTVTLKLEAPEEEISYNTERYTNAIQVKITLEGATNASTRLAVPVKITIPVPTGLDTGKNIVIIHVHSDGTREEITPKLSDGKLSFVVTSFSEFLFANKEGSSSSSSSSSDEETVFVDRDTFKSEVASKTILAVNPANSAEYMDMKAHALDARTTTNQAFLANYYAKSLGGSKANVVIHYGVYTRRALNTAEKGTKRTLVWKNLSGTKAGAIYAVCYDIDNKAYLLSGTVDANGTATFKDYIYSEACNMTLFTVE